MSELSCPGDSSNCHSHFHDEDSRHLATTNPTRLEENLVGDRSITPVASAFDNEASEAPEAQPAQNLIGEEKEAMFRKIIRNFTPSYAKVSLRIDEKGSADSSHTSQMVHHHDEHGSAVNCDPPDTVPRPLAQHHLDHPVRSQPRPVLALHFHFGAAVSHAS
jgi:hypothetical protein